MPTKNTQLPSNERLTGITIPLYCSSIDSARWGNTIYTVARVTRQAPESPLRLVIQADGDWRRAVKSLEPFESSTCEVILADGPRSGQFCKSRMVNVGVADIAPCCDWVLQVDADIHTDFNDLLTFIESQKNKVGFVLPCKYFALLNKEQSRAVMQGEKISLADYKANNFPGAGLIAFSVSAFQRVGMMDVRFVGWGGEDIDFANRLRAKYSYSVGPHYAAHLWHEDDRQVNPSNYDLLRQLSSSA